MYKSNKELVSFADKIGYSNSLKNGIVSQIYQSSEITDSLTSNPFFNIIEKLFNDITLKEALSFVKEIQSFSVTDIDTVQDFYDTSYSELSLIIPLAVLFFWYQSKQTVNLYSSPPNDFWKKYSTSKDKSVYLILQSNCAIYYISEDKTYFDPKKNKVVFVDFSINYKTKKSFIPKKIRFGENLINVITLN